MSNHWSRCLISLLPFVLALIFALTPKIVQASESQPPAISQTESTGRMSADELNRQLNNPVSSVWSMVFQNNYTQLKSGTLICPGWDKGDNKWFYNLNFQPVLPLPMTRDWNLINRPVIPLFADRPVLESDGFNDVDGMGDITLCIPIVAGENCWKFSLGAGHPSSSPRLPKTIGAAEVAGRPAAVGLHLGKEWILGIFPAAFVVLCGKRQSRIHQPDGCPVFRLEFFPVSGRSVQRRTSRSTGRPMTITN